MLTKSDCFLRTSFLEGKPAFCFHQKKPSLQNVKSKNVRIDINTHNKEKETQNKANVICSFWFLSKKKKNLSKGWRRKLRKGLQKRFLVYSSRMVRINKKKKKMVSKKFFKISSFQVVFSSNNIIRFLKYFR